MHNLCGHKCSAIRVHVDFEIEDIHSKLKFNTIALQKIACDKFVYFEYFLLFPREFMHRC